MRSWSARAAVPDVNASVRSQRPRLGAGSTLEQVLAVFRGASGSHLWVFWPCVECGPSGAAGASWQRQRCDLREKSS